MKKISLIWLLAWLVVSCQPPTSTETDDLFGGGDSAGDGQNSSVQPAPPGPPPPANPPAPDSVSGNVWISGGEAKGFARNDTREIIPCYLSVYLRPGTQHRFSMDTREIQTYSHRRFASDLPDCGCEDTLVQIDLSCYKEPPKIYNWPDKLPGMVLDNMQHTVRACKDCPTECEPKGKKDCPEQVWDYDLCRWVGDCGCQKVCDYPHIVNPFTCNCECPPSGIWYELSGKEIGWTTTYHCPVPGEVFNPDTCKCECSIECGPGYHTHPGVCDCFCSPKGEPYCPEQTWDETICAWIGECPCVEQTCGFGLEWDQDKCKCEPMDLCHVSNKGKDGNWNIQEQQKKFNPGHAGHLDPAKFCPPDYFGICDGRYSAAPHPCMVQP